MTLICSTATWPFRSLCSSPTSSSDVSRRCGDSCGREERASTDGADDLRCAASKGKIAQQSTKAIVTGVILKSLIALSFRNLTKPSASVKPQFCNSRCIEGPHMSDRPIELDVLAVFSHPDDAELSVSGTLLKLKTLGYRTGVCDMTRGEMGTRGTAEIRAEEAREAARVMKLDVRVNLDQPDGHVWLTEEARTAMVRIIRAHQPKVLLTTHWDDPHPDHANTSRIAREAARLATMARYDEGSEQAPVPMPAIMHSIFSR